MHPHVYWHLFVTCGLDDKCKTVTSRIRNYSSSMIRLEHLNTQNTKMKMESETHKLKITITYIPAITNKVKKKKLKLQQMDGCKNKEPVTTSWLEINLYRDKPMLYDKNCKDYGSKAIMKKVFAPILAKLPQKSITDIKKQVAHKAFPSVFSLKHAPAVCSLGCTGHANSPWSMLQEQNPLCALAFAPCTVCRLN